MKRLIEAIEARIKEIDEERKAARTDPVAYDSLVTLIHELVFIKDVAIDEQASLIKELEATISEAGNIIAVSHAIKIVKGEET